MSGSTPTPPTPPPGPGSGPSGGASSGDKADGAPPPSGASPSGASLSGAGPEGVGPATPPTPPKTVLERPHPLTPLVRGWIVFAAMVVALAQNYLPDGSGDSGGLPPWWVLGLGVAGIALITGVSGFASWWFTRFVIDEREVRVETGWLNRRSRRVPFERVQSVDVDQPFVARLVGLAELRIEAGGGASGTALRYIPRARAYALRDYLMARAAGHRVDLAQPGTVHHDLLNDTAATDRVLVTLPIGRILGAFLLSVEMWLSVAVTVTLIVVGVVSGVAAISLAAILPMLYTLGSAVSRRLTRQANYRLLETSAGALRVSAGLTRLVSQTVPVDRIQGVRLSQPLPWRPLRWWQVDIDMVGILGRAGEEGGGRAESTVVPVATEAELPVVLAALLPGIDLAAVRLSPVPRRARWIRWFDAQTLWWGATDQVSATRRGLLVRISDLVPLRTFQSLRLTRGPLQRLLGLASVHVDTTPGPVDQVACHLDGRQAQAYVDRLLLLGREARRQLRP